ncbi:hypothetical protein DL765_008881 [Monosporascus sp. GIB2]|nr:hypothetical protein DL765_008881 [Monosporascus sp. GIB2]
MPTTTGRSRPSRVPSHPAFSTRRRDEGHSSSPLRPRGPRIRTLDLPEVSVNGADQGLLRGVRAPDSDYPIQNVNDADFACNKDIRHKDGTVIPIPAGARPQGPHLGVPREGGQRGHGRNDRAQVVQGGRGRPEQRKVGRRHHDRQPELAHFTIPPCVAPGDYLMRVELLALHSAYAAGGAQFYMECAQIRVTGSGTNKGSSFVSFPDAYSANDPGLVISIYDNNGNPNNGGKPYAIPGPRPLTF